MTNLILLQEWFKSQCDEDWEHNFGIKIETLDNPGWYILIDLEDTNLENIQISESKVVGDNDWYHIKVSKKKLECSGDVNKLSFLINRVVNILNIDNADSVPPNVYD